MKNKLGIIMLSYNRSDVVSDCINSVSKTKNKIPFELFVLDNASGEGEFLKIKETFNFNVQNNGLKGSLLRSEVNHGFPAGNNIGIKHFLKDPSITHICLLNSDVIVTDGWIDFLIEKNVDSIGPVTNACGNEQTIPITFSLKAGDSVNFKKVNDFSVERNNVFKGFKTQTEWLGFFCFLAKKEVFEKVGMLDERFGRGGFEDDDYCIRILENNFKMFIARDVYVFHYGTASFLQIPMKELLSHIDNNKIIFENKYNKKWKERNLLPMLSFYQDMNFVLEKNKNKHVLNLFNLYYKKTEDFVFSLSNSVKKEEKVVAPSVLKNNFKKFIFFKKIKKAFCFLVKNKSILFLVKYPNGEELKDGYFQRIYSIDNMLPEYKRFYVNYVDPHDGFFKKPHILRVKNNVFEFQINRNSFFQRFLILFFVLIIGRVYSHSILRLESFFHKTLFLLGRKRVLDIHGVVPEEFKMHEDYSNYNKFNKIEKFSIKNSNLVVGVTKKMINFIFKKHKINNKKFVILPILPKRNDKKIIYEKNLNNIIYSGGVQKWQQLDKMLDFVKKNKDKYNFTFLVPDPHVVKDLYQNKFGDVFPGVVESVPSDMVSNWYEKSSFGLVLREDIIVNNAACPTKIIEYFEYGLIPIVDSSNIGDFLDKGYSFVNYNENLPDFEKWKEGVKNNYDIYKEICREYDFGVAEILNFIK